MNAETVLLPELGEGVTEGELVKWLVSEGSLVKSDQPIAEVMTDKASMEVPSPASGVVKSLLVKEGETVPVGQPLLAFAADNPPNQKRKPPLNKPTAETLSPSLAAAPPALVGAVKSASPLARRLAKTLGVDLQNIKTSGIRITKQDILQHSQQKPPGGEPETKQKTLSSETHLPLKGVRKKMAERMKLAAQTIPHFTLLESAQVEKLNHIKNSVQNMLKDQTMSSSGSSSGSSPQLKNPDIKITYLSFVMKAFLQTVKEFPELNAVLSEDKIILKHYYHFGFACATPRGLLVPVVKNVDQKSLKETAAAIQTLAEKARAGRSAPEDLSEGTATITNIGSLGGHSAAPIINPPETAILGMYRLFVKPCWDGEAFQPQKTMNFSLTCDHRLIDGALAARSLRFFVDRIENPFSLFI